MSELIRSLIGVGILVLIGFILSYNRKAIAWRTVLAALAMNVHISFSGIVTFKSAKDLMEVARQVPLDRMLIETDSPYLAPAPFRGKMNQPGYVRHVAEHIAALRGISVEEVAAATTANFFGLFKHARR